MIRIDKSVESIGRQVKFTTISVTSLDTRVFKANWTRTNMQFGCNYIFSASDARLLSSAANLRKQS